jgi:hypothetical protein
MLERLALQMLERGLRLADAATDRDAVTPSISREHAELLEHARTCQRCHDLLLHFQETEETLSAELMALQSTSDESPSVRGPDTTGIFLLKPFRSKRDDEAPPDADVSPSYDLAADAGSKDGTGGDSKPDRAMTLRSEDGLFQLRILSRGSAEGAIAVLIDDPDVQPPGGSSRDVASRLSFALRVGDQEFAFDQHNIAYLPCFPSDAVYVVVR